jgi:hypothetical protein
MNRTIIAFAFTAIAALSFSTSAQAQLQITDTETFRVRIQSLFSINAPGPEVVLTHDESNNDQAFPTQTWLVTSNNATGATVTFATDQAFTHTADISYKRDASLGLSIASGTGNAWTVNVASAQTDYANGDEVVVVSADSNRAGAASFLLDVSFIEETFTDLAAGDYEMTVTGTLSAN